MTSGKLIKVGATIAFIGSVPLMLYAEFGPRDANPVGLGLLMVASWLLGGLLMIVGAFHRFWSAGASSLARSQSAAPSLAIGDPSIGILEKTMFGDWSGKLACLPGRRIPVTYVEERADSMAPAEIERAVSETVKFVARSEESLRKTAAEAWLPVALDEVPAASGWDAERLAASFTLAGIILGNSHATFILEYATTLPIDKQPKTWFNADGSLSHISGHLDQ